MSLAGVSVDLGDAFAGGVQVDFRPPFRYAKASPVHIRIA